MLESVVVVTLVAGSPGVCRHIVQCARVEVKTEPQEEADLPATGDYHVEEEAAEADHEEEVAEGDQEEEAAAIVTPVQSQKYISDLVHEIMSSGKHPSVAEVEVKLREVITKEINKAQTNLGGLNKATTEQYERKCEELNKSWAQKFE